MPNFLPSNMFYVLLTFLTLQHLPLDSTFKSSVGEMKSLISFGIGPAWYSVWYFSN